MRALLGSTALAAVLLTAACGLGGPKYPEFGEASYRIEGTATSPDGGQPVSTVIYRDGALMRVETVLPGRGPATIVFDQATSDAFIITAATAAVAAPSAAAPAPGSAGASVAPPPAQPAAPAANGPTSIAPPAPPAQAQPAQPAAAAPAPAQAAVGVAVRLDEADAPAPIEDAWAALGAKGAKHVGACEVAGEKGQSWTPREQTEGVAREACITDDGIVLQVTEGGAALWQATKLERGKQDATLFGIPAGYAVVDPKAVADTVGETMKDLNTRRRLRLSDGSRHRLLVRA
jgi:hypothetical protein